MWGVGLQLRRCSGQREEQEQRRTAGGWPCVWGALTVSFGWKGVFRDQQRGGGKAWKVTPNHQAKEDLGKCSISSFHSRGQVEKFFLVPTGGGKGGWRILRISMHFWVDSREGLGTGRRSSEETCSGRLDSRKTSRKKWQWQQAKVYNTDWGSSLHKRDCDSSWPQ